MPPRPPRPPREGGRREEQSGEPPKQSKLRRAWDQAGNALSLPRALMASLDLSAPLRQGAILTLPPSQWGRAMKATAQMIKSLNTKQFERFVGRLQSHPDRPLADEAGLHLSNKEEDFSSEWTQKIPLVKQSEQAYTSYLDSLRLDTFSRYNKAIEKAALNADDAKAARKAAAEWINVATGRGSLGESFERAMPVLSKLLFSPRYTASRFQVLNPYTYAKNLRTPGGRIVARNQMADLVQFLGVTGATLALASMAGADVDDDLQSSDFGKIRVGNTRYDIFAGLLQPLRMMYRVGRDLSGAAVGKESAKGENAMEIAGKFARSKLAPVPSYFVDAVTRKDFIGRDFDPKRGAVERVLPLMWRDFYEAVQREGSLGAAKMTPGFFGIGVQDYEKRPGALGLTGRSKFVQEMRNAGLDYKFAPPLKDEPASLHRARAEKIEQWLSTYGEKLVSHPRWGQLSAEEKKTAISNLRRRVSENANLKQPSTADFDAGRIIAGVKRAATEKPKSDRKKIYAEP